MPASGINKTLVPLLLELSEMGSCNVRFPNSNSALVIWLSRTDSTLKIEDNALTAFVPTPLSPTDFLKAWESYFPPVFILETTSTTFPRGIPLP